MWITIIGQTNNIPKLDSFQQFGQVSAFLSQALDLCYII